MISLSILRGVRRDAEEREDYLRPRRGRKARTREPTLDARPHGRVRAQAEEFILTVTANGYGKRTSAYEYRRTNRGGQGITNIVNVGPQRSGGRQLPGASRASS